MGQIGVYLTPVAGERLLVIENRKIEDAKWRLWIPEIFIGERDDDRFPSAKEVQWEESENQAAYTWTNEGAGPVPIKYTVSASRSDDSIDLSFKVSNIGGSIWTKRFSAAVCLSNKEASDFIDPDGKRTILITDKGPETVWNLVEELHSMPTIKWQGMNFYVEEKDRRQDEILPLYPNEIIGCSIKYGLVIRESLNKRWKISFGWNKVARVDIVLGTDSMSCIHSHPQFEKLLPGGSMTVYGKIWFSRDDVKKIVNNYKKFMSRKDTSNPKS